MMKDLMINWLEKYNQTSNEPVTRLYFENNDTTDFVEDYTYFANENYMSKELLASLTKGKTLTNELLSELEQFRFEMKFKLSW